VLASNQLGDHDLRLPGGRLPAPAPEARASGNRSNDLGWPGLLRGDPTTVSDPLPRQRCGSQNSISWYGFVTRILSDRPSQVGQS